MIGNGIFTRNHSINSEEEEKEIDSEDDIGLSLTYKPYFEDKKVDDKRINIKKFIRSRHMRTSTTSSDGGFLDLISRELRQKDFVPINFTQNVLTNKSSSLFEKEEEKLKNEDDVDLLINKCGENNSNNNLLNEHLNSNINNLKSSNSSISSSCFTFTTDSHIGQFIEGQKKNNLIFESYNSSSIELNKNINSNVNKFIEGWDEDEQNNEINKNLIGNGHSNNIFDLKNQSSSTSSNTQLLDIEHLPQLNSAHSCSTLQEIPTEDYLKIIQNPLSLFNEKLNLSELARKLNVNFEFREDEGSFVFSQPNSKHIIIFNQQLYFNKDGQQIEGIRISLHKNERLYREGHLWPIEKWLGMVTLEGVCKHFFSSSDDI